MMNDVILFARTFLKEPRMLGSVVPSSRFLVNRLMRMIDWEQASVIVEYGPGIGNISSQMLRELRPDGRILCLEMNRDFVDHLEENCGDPRLIVLHQSAERVLQALAKNHLGSADYILSGIPFSTMPDDLRMRILHNSYRALRPGGEMIVYQFSGAVLRDLRRVFGSVEEQREPLNILPARIFRARKMAAALDKVA